jgi:ATP-dependent helicase/nuclease subunit B
VTDSPPEALPNARLVAHLEAGGVVVTATRRQARLLRRLHELAQRQAGRQVWRSADVLPLDAWLERCWLDLSAAEGGRRLLTPAQALWAWRQAVESDIESSLLESRDLAAAARASWLALLQHGGATQDLEFTAITQDQRRFARWAQGAEQSLRLNGWIDPALLPAAIAERADRLQGHARLLFAGFVQPAPALLVLVAALVRAGCTAELVAGARPVAAAQQHVAQHPEAELEALLDWVLLRLGAQPRSLLGIVMPDLATRRSSVERAFAAALQPGVGLPGGLERDRLFDFAGGPPLASLEIVGDALACLETVAWRLDGAALSRLLRSPYLGQPEEAEARARFDVALRRAGLYALPIREWERRTAAAGCPSIAAGLAGSAALAEVSVDLGASTWASRFGELLRVWGWPGTRPLASDEFQAAGHFREVLGQFAALEQVAPVLSQAAARDELVRACAAPFQPERGDAPVLVYDHHEAPGLGFDGLWVSGLTASAWPRAPAPDPFLPLALQRRLGLPDASAAACQEAALSVTSAWLGTAPQVVFSWPQRQDDAEESPSRLLPAGLPECRPPPRPPALARRLFASSQRLPLADDFAPALVPAQARGGTRIVELQAQCPFRAFAELRLAARALEEPGPGVDRRLRGTLLHDALERVWAELRCSEALQALDAESRAVLVQRCVRAALEPGLPAHCGPRVRALEAAWQVAAVTALLEVDATREPFSVADVEAELQRTLAGVPMTLRIDRIDRVGDARVLIDYKTGKPSLTQWRGARPDAPQLPLYAVLAGGPVAAIAFASVSARAARYRALGVAEAAVPGLLEAERFALTETEDKGFSWAEIRQRWGAVLAQLAAQFRDGVADVDPKRPQTCRLCHLETLCRVERQAAEDGETVDADA